MEREPKETDRLNQKVQEVKDIMQHNMELAIDRGVELNTVHDQTDVLKEEAKKFKRNAQTYKNQTCRQNMKWWIFIAIISILILGAVILVIVVSVLVTQKS